jgi:hypothetical protein
MVVILFVQAAGSDGGDGNDIDGARKNSKNSSNSFLETSSEHWPLLRGQRYALYDL